MIATIKKQTFYIGRAMDIFGEDAGTLLWKYGGMTSAAVGAITTLTLVVLNALSDSKPRRGYEHRHDDEDSKNHQGAIGNDHGRSSHTSNSSSNNKDDDVGDAVSADVDGDFDDEEDKNEHHHPVNESSVAFSNQNSRSSKKKYYSK